MRILGIYFYTFDLSEPLRSIDVPSPEPAEFCDIHHSAKQQRPWNLLRYAGDLIATNSPILFRFLSSPPFTEPVESCTRLLRHDPHSSLIAADFKGTLFSILPIPHSRGLHAIFCLICFAVIYDHFGGSVRDDSNMIRTCKSPCGRSRGLCIHLLDIHSKRPDPILCRWPLLRAWIRG